MWAFQILRRQSLSEGRRNQISVQQRRLRARSTHDGISSSLVTQNQARLRQRHAFQDTRTQVLISINLADKLHHRRHYLPHRSIGLVFQLEIRLTHAPLVPFTTLLPPLALPLPQKPCRPPQFYTRPRRITSSGEFCPTTSPSSAAPPANPLPAMAPSWAPRSSNPS